MKNGLLVLNIILTIAVGYLLIKQFSSSGNNTAAKNSLKDSAGHSNPFRIAYFEMDSIESSFTQEKVLTALTEKITSTGQFWFKRSNRVRIEYLKPFTYTMIMNGDKMLLRDDQKENRVNVRSNKLFQQINQIMIDFLAKYLK